tara:strand:+ start:292 stop:2406 length:2115 start_codon:yes stop_codon:yes gene_type:complete
LKISILLPYKENFSPTYAGAVSLNINETLKISKYKKNTTVFGNTEYRNKFKHKYINIPLKKIIFQSQNKKYVEQFVKLEKKRNSDLIELHNRPIYLTYLTNELKNKTYILYFHNDPLTMSGSKTISDRKFLVNNCFKIIFNSSWSKKRFLEGLDASYESNEKLIVINQSAKKNLVDLKKKEKIITFVGKLNRSKGYDLFGAAIIKILNKYKDWSATVIGDEPRDKLIFNHKNLKKLGFINHNKVIKIYKKTSIAVVCSRWEEPFGRTSLEASANGCAVIISNRGGLPETITDGVTLKKLTVESIYLEIEKLILSKISRNKLQKDSLRKFFLTHEYISGLIDKVRDQKLLSGFKINLLNKKIKIINIYNVGQKINHRLFNISIGKKFTNGFIRNNHDVLEISDRDFVKQNRTLNLSNSYKVFQEYLIGSIKNYNPNIIFFGHSDNIDVDTLKEIKNLNNEIVISQWNEDPMMKSLNDSILNINKLLKYNDYVDANFITTDPKVVKERNKSIKNLNFFFIPVDKNIETYNVYNMKPQNDIFYAMSHGVNRATLKRGKFDERVLFLDKLTKKINSIKYDFYGYKNREPVWGNNFYKALTNSKMGLNLSRGNPTKYYTSNRIASLIGNGLLTFVDKKTKLNEIFNNNEVVFYENIEDLSSKIKFYLNNERIRRNIAKSGKKKYFKLFNEKRISDYLIKRSLGKKFQLF